MKSTLLKAIQKAIYEVLSTNIDAEDISFNKDEMGSAQRSIEKFTSSARWEMSDLHKALSDALFVNDMDILIKHYTINKISESSLNIVQENELYDNCEYILLSNIDIFEINTLLTYRGWKNFNIKSDQNNIIPDMYYDNIQLINTVYTERFINKDLKGLYFSYDNNMIALYYKSGTENRVAFIMSGNITDEVFNKCRKNYKPVPEPKSASVCKALSSIRVQPKKFGFMPVIDPDGNLYYETYVIYKEKVQTDEFSKLYTKLSKITDLTVENGNFDITNKDKSVKFYKDLPDGRRFSIYQFEEDLHDGLHKYGWRIDVQ